METLLASGASNESSYKGSEIKLGRNSLGDWKGKGLYILSSQIFHESDAGPDSAVASFNLAAVKNTEVTQLCEYVCGDTVRNEARSDVALLLLILMRWKLSWVCLHKLQSYLPIAI